MARQMRLDELPLDRRIAGEFRGRGDISQLPAVFERRDVDPVAPIFRRRHGSVRSTSTLPNLLGLAYDGNAGRVDVDHDFNASISTSWTIFGTVRTPENTTSQDAYAPLVSINGVHLYIKHIVSTGFIQFQVYSSAGTLLASSVAATRVGFPDFRFALKRSGTTVAINAWYVPDPGATALIGADASASFTPDDTKNRLRLFGSRLAALTNGYDEVILSNVLFYDASGFSTSNYEAIAADLTPATSIISPISANLLWHDALSGGGKVLSYTDGSAATLLSYLIPAAPVAYGETPTTLHFGGNGTIEIPFYADFDEYYWTTSNASARLEWCFQVVLRLPKVLDADATVFEFQDMARLRIKESGGSYYFEASFHNDGAVVTGATALTAGSTYTVYVARDLSFVYLTVGASEASASAPNPVIFDYDKSLGFLIGDRAEFEASEPFAGRITRFALHNLSARQLHPVTTAVLYYDVASAVGDEIIDKGNRALNALAGYRSSTEPPFYREGAIVGGSYVAATGGYLINNAAPGAAYTGELVKPLTSDAVVQRRGDIAFLTSNGVSYVVDDFAKSFRPLGVPRPSTKVTCTPQGVGAIDGFVRYAYRFVSENGTVGPIFELDPCKATGGVNVFLGAEVFGLPTETPFGLSYGNCEGTDVSGRGAVSSNTVELFIGRDYDTTGDADPTELHQELDLTAEFAFRLPDVASKVKESVISQGVYMPYGPGRWFADPGPGVSFNWIKNKFQEACFQFSFRYKYDASNVNQVLFGLVPRDQHWDKSHLTGTDNFWRKQQLLVSIQIPEDAVNNTASLVIVRPKGSGNKITLPSSMERWSLDYNFQDGHDYTLFVRRSGSLYGNPSGADLAVSIFNHTLDGTSDGLGGTYNGWKLWPHDPAAHEIYAVNFWGADYSNSMNAEMLWGAGRIEGSDTGVKTIIRSAGTTFAVGYLYPFINGTDALGNVGQVMYHARAWYRDFPFPVLSNKALERNGAKTGPLAKDLYVDIAFCSDSSQEKLEGGWDRKLDVRVDYKASNGGKVPAAVLLTSSVSGATLFAYGFDNTITEGSPDTHVVTSLNKVPLWARYSSRNNGSLSIGTGQTIALEIANEKWHAGAELKVFTDFANTVDLSQWTWLTLYFDQKYNFDASQLVVWLERVFINGNTGDWGSLYNADVTPDGPGGKAQNLAAGAGQFTLYTLGGVPGIDSEFSVELAEFRLWDGERYTASGGGDGEETFGPYLSNRVPPNYYDQLWHYVRFAEGDVDDIASPSTVDQLGQFGSQTQNDAVVVYQGATIDNPAGSNTGSSYYVPFPEAPSSAVRGIELFRSQVAPVQETYPNGQTNPKALVEGFKAVKDAPLYSLTEIPIGTQFYLDTAADSFLGAELDAAIGVIPANPGGVVEFAGYIGIWVTDRPRIYFSASPKLWESYPTDLIYDIPLKEYGTIQAATELGARDDRQSRLLVLGKSWGVFLEGSPGNIRTNTLGGGVGAWSARCLVVNRGIAYSFNGTLWAITGDGQIEDIGFPVLDLLPEPGAARLAVSSKLGSLFVINETTGLALRYHFARREWFVEDRYALSVTDIDGVDNWVSKSGYPAAGDTSVYGDDIDSDTGVYYTLSGFNPATKAFTVNPGNTTGLSVGQRVTVVANEDPRKRGVFTIASIPSSFNLLVNEAISLPTTGTDLSDGDGTVTYTYRLYPGIGEWGTMLDTGQFVSRGSVDHVDVGVTNGDRWYASVAAADFAGDPTDRSGFDADESYPALVDPDLGGSKSCRWGVGNSQRIQRLLFWNPVPSAVGLSELELTYTPEGEQ